MFNDTVNKYHATAVVDGIKYERDGTLREVCQWVDDLVGMYGICEASVKQIQQEETHA